MEGGREQGRKAGRQGGEGKGERERKMLAMSVHIKVCVPQELGGEQFRPRKPRNGLHA